jgi:hypothetical protein
MWRRSFLILRCDVDLLAVGRARGHPGRLRTLASVLEWCLDPVARLKVN